MNCPADERESGWYWVRLDGKDKPQAKEWCIDGDIKFWNYLVGAEAPKVTEVICRIPYPGEFADLVTEAITGSYYTASATHVMLPIDALIALGCATETQRQRIQEEIRKFNEQNESSESSFFRVDRICWPRSSKG